MVLLLNRTRRYRFVSLRIPSGTTDRRKKKTRRYRLLRGMIRRAETCSSHVLADDVVPKDRRKESER
jgi:hypothetical protein